MPKGQTLQERVDRERKAHTESDILEDSSRIKARFPHVQYYLSKQRLYALVDTYLKDIEGKKVLDYGCGRGQESIKCLERGATVFGIDISPDYIADAKSAAQDAGFSFRQFSFHVMDAHKLKFAENTFDIVLGYGVLHHLILEIALSEIHRVLKPGGRALLIEPLADNPLLKFFRLLTPHARTEDEKPLSKSELDCLLHKDQWKTKMDYCGLLEAPVAMVTSLIIPKHPDNIFFRMADIIEPWTHNHGLLLSWNQYVYLNMQKR